MKNNQLKKINAESEIKILIAIKDIHEIKKHNYEQDRDSTIIREVNAGTAKFAISKQESIFRDSFHARKSIGKIQGTKGSSKSYCKKPSDLARETRLDSNDGQWKVIHKNYLNYTELM